MRFASRWCWLRQIRAEKGSWGKMRTNIRPLFPVVDVKVVLNNPALCKLELPSVRDFVADCDYDARSLVLALQG
jgi:hypothetical protein